MDNPVAMIALLRSIMGNRMRRRPPFKAGRWYPLSQGAPAVAGAVMAASTLYLMPFYLEQTMTVSDLGGRVTTLAASGNVKVAIYASDPLTQLPTGLPVAESGAMSTTTAGLISSDVVGADKVLPPGLYYMASMADATAAGTVVVQSSSNASSQHTWLIGAASINNASGGSATNQIQFTTACTYASGFPDVTAATLAETTSSIGVFTYAKAA